MSTPPEQPSAYPYPNPQLSGGYGPPAQPAGMPIPGQHPPYAQQPGPPSPYGPPIPPAGGGTGRALIGALAGTVAASTLWGGGILLLGAEAKPDLAGYELRDNLCTAAERSSFEPSYPDEDGSPTHDALEHPALDTMTCSLGLKFSGSSYSDAYLYFQVDLHKETDPAAEFTAQWETYEDREGGYEVEEVQGIGDEAYLVAQDTTDGGDSGSLSTSLAVRDGWMTYSVSWSAYLSSYDTDDHPSVSEVSDWLRTDTGTTLERLRDQ